MTDSSDRNRPAQLGAFLRTHREQLSAAAAGLPPTGRRRTSGLRREEVAQLAGLSATWYCRIEQGRADGVSAAVLSHIADALQLGRAERAHAFDLAERHDPRAKPPEPADRSRQALQRCVDQFSGPAYLLDDLWTARRWNDAATWLFPGWLDAAPERVRNLLRYVFLAPAARRLIRDWEGRAKRLVAEFRSDFGRQLDHPALQALVEDLRAGSPVFQHGWNERQVLDREGGLRQFDHPEAGLLTYDQLTLLPTHDPRWKLVVLMPVVGNEEL